MTKLQYLALRTVFGAEIARRDDRDLAKIIKTLVDDPIEHRIDESTQMDASPQDDAAMASGASGLRESHGDAASGRKAKPKPPLSAAMQALAVITAALASGTAAGVLTYLMFPNGGSGKPGKR